jgi:transcription elongation factor Elf1
MKQSHNSFISQYFFNIIKYEMKCQNCNSYYNYSHKIILEFDVDLYRNYRDQAFPQKSCMNLNMDECFTNYIGGKQYNCIYCNNPGFIYSTISRPSKVLIISFKRNNHNYSCDIDFDLKINIAKYCSKDNISGINSNTVYNLKAIIGLNNNQQYFADVLINNFWFRFINNQVNTLVNVNNDIHIFEPQLLIYELNNNMQDNQFIKMWMMKNYQMQNMKMNIMMQKQMMMNMMKKQKMDQILNGILGQ